MSRRARIDHQIHEILEQRWSPCGFAKTPVSTEDLKSLFEAARWAASSYNEQPWRYIIATRDDAQAFDHLLSCLVKANQAWARFAPVIALGIAKRTFSGDGSQNRVALHDLGAASASLTFEAGARGLRVHQMGGIHRDKARALYQIPDDFDVVTALAVGYSARRQACPMNVGNETVPLASEYHCRNWSLGKHGGVPGTRSPNASSTNTRSLSASQAVQETRYGHGEVPCWRVSL